MILLNDLNNILEIQTVTESVTLLITSWKNPTNIYSEVGYLHYIQIKYLQFNLYDILISLIDRMSHIILGV